jgi:hypothetical protein
MNETQSAIARQHAKAIIARMHVDSAFIDQLIADPRATLAAAGMPADLLDASVEDLGIGPEDETVGHARPTSKTRFRYRTIWAEALSEKDAPAPEGVPH